VVAVYVEMETDKQIIKVTNGKEATENRRLDGETTNLTRNNGEWLAW
jgi:hypothetical protein